MSTVSPPTRDAPPQGSAGALETPMYSRRQSVRRAARLLAAAALLCSCAWSRPAHASPWQDVAGRRQQQQQGPSADSIRQTIARARGGALDDAGFAEARAVGYELIRAARFDEAAALFGALAARRPDDAATLYGAALSAFNAKRAAEAEPFARRAAEVALAAGGAKEGAADALVLLAVVLAVRGDDAGSLVAARQAADLAPRNFDAQFTLGRALYGAGDAAGASRAFRAARTLKPGDARAHFFLATTLERAGADAEALDAYRELARLRPDEAEGHLGLGVLLVKRGGAGVEEGLRELSRAIEIKPDLYEARVTLGRALVARSRAAEAVEHLKRAAALAPDNPEPHYQLSLAYKRLGRREEAAAESEIVRRIHESRRAAGVPGSGAQPPPKP
ncbi:MAG: tetratricopeptide repeat protein [Pyrinomonadaceae bacterium]